MGGLGGRFAAEGKEGGAAEDVRKPGWMGNSSAAEENKEVRGRGICLETILLLRRGERWRSRFPTDQQQHRTRPLRWRGLESHPHALTT